MNNKIFYLSIGALAAIAIVLVLFVRSGENRGGGAALSIISEKQSYNIGEEIKAYVYLDTKGKAVDGVDVVVIYDFEHILPSGEQIFLGKEGSVFSSFAGPKINKEDGIIKFSALSREGEKFNGKGKVAALSFIAEKKGEASIRFVFQPGQTLDSNISDFEAGADVLGETKDIVFSID